MFPILKPQNIYRYILDDISVSPLMAASIRKLKSSYSGSCLRVRRSSDNAAMDIGFVGASLDLATMISFVGAGDGFITVFYDQTGNSRNYTQVNASLQPRIITAGVLEILNGLPTIHIYNSADIGLQTGFANFGPSERTCFYVKKAAAISGCIWPSSGNLSANQSYFELIDGANQYAVARQGVQNIIGISTANTMNLEQITLRYGASAFLQEIWRNSIQLGTGIAGANYPNITDSIVIGGYPGFSPDMYLSECMFFDSALSDANQFTYEGNAQAFFGI